MVDIGGQQFPLTEVTDLVDQESDFSFELLVANKLKKDGWNVTHGGIFEDPITGKNREFDIRAFYDCSSISNSFYRVALSIEVKNLKSPLIAHLIPRIEEESFVETVKTQDNSFAPYKKERCDKVYLKNKSVCKSLNQITYHNTQKKLVLKDDSDIFEKWSQALASVYAIAKSNLSNHNGKSEMNLVVIPILVIPNKKLLSQSYDSSGEKKESLSFVGRVSKFVNKNLDLNLIDNNGASLGVIYNISHIEIIEFDEIINLREILCRSFYDYRYHCGWS